MSVNEAMRPARFFFEKSGRAVYISHLDLTRAMGRALARSGLPVWHTQGFHPHVYMTFALPLSLGTTGLRESMDFRLTAPMEYDEVTARLSAALPEGLRGHWTADPVMEPKEIFWADYRVALRCDPSQGSAALASFCALNEVTTQKRGKKGMRTVDIRPLFRLLDCREEPRGLALSLRCRAGVETNLNPTLVLDALCQTSGLALTQSRIIRLTALTEGLEEFR